MADNMIFTKYKVLKPADIDGMFSFVEYVYWETERFSAKSAEFIRDTLIQKGRHTEEIRVIKM